MALIVIDVTDQVSPALDRLRGRMESPGPLLKAIGDSLLESTKDRFGKGQAPDGTPWAPNSPVTIARYLKRSGGPKRPLIGESKALSTKIAYQVDGNELLVGTPQKYGAVQQFGAAKGSLGRRAPWGDIPPRPFLGISDEDRSMIERTVLSFLGDSNGSG